MFPALIKSYSKKIFDNLKLFIKWTAISLISGLGVGSVGIAFVYCMNFATNMRTTHDYLIYFLPLGGLAIVFLYNITNSKEARGTNLVLSTLHAESEIPIKMAPLIFVTTVITHFVGGSTGREGAALQIGGSIGNTLGKWFHLDDRDKRVVIMCSMSAAFSAVFGTPLAAAFFSMEVVSVGVMYYAALVPCVFSSLIASQLAIACGVNFETFSIINLPVFSVFSGLKISLLSLLCAGVSIIFCIMLHGFSKLYNKYLINPYIRIVTGGCLIIAFTLIVGSRDYLGIGIPLIEHAVSGNAKPLSFLLKMIFTALTIGAGYKGGEIVPSFCVGATFGCLFGNILGFSPSLCAAVGMIAVFCGVTNCPITSLLIGFELFGFEGFPFFLIAIAISYSLSGYYGLYSDQTIVYSKYKAQFINCKTRKLL